MRAIQIVSLDGPHSVRSADVSPPEPADAVIVEVHAAGVSFPELLQTRGMYQTKPELPFVPGSEVAGVVRFAPPGAHVAVGDRVAAFCGIGGFAEMVAADVQAVFPLPDDTSYLSAAALPMNYLTMHFGLCRRGHVRADETVVVHGAAGGIGTASIQIARALGARIIAVTSTPEKGEVAKKAGADSVVSADSFRVAVAELTGGRGADVVVDPVGGDRFTDSLRCLAPEGRLLVIGFTAGEIPIVKVNRLLLNNLDVVGVGWGAFWAHDHDYLQEQWGEMLPMLSSGQIDPVIGSIFDLSDAGDALSHLENRQAVGKTLLQIR